MDGDGPMPTFYWGSLPSPTIFEYYRRKSYYDFIYLVPYLWAGVVLAVVGCVVAPWIASRMRRGSRRPSVRVALVTAALLFLAMLVSDAGSALRVWRGPLIVLYRGLNLYEIVTLATTLLMLSALAGLAEYVRRRFRA